MFHSSTARPALPIVPATPSVAPDGNPAPGIRPLPPSAGLLSEGSCSSQPGAPGRDAVLVRSPRHHSTARTVRGAVTVVTRCRCRERYTATSPRRSATDCTEQLVEICSSPEPAASADACIMTTMVSVEPTSQCHPRPVAAPFPPYSRSSAHLGRQGPAGSGLGQEATRLRRDRVGSGRMRQARAGSGARAAWRTPHRQPLWRRHLPPSRDGRGASQLEETGGERRMAVDWRREPGDDMPRRAISRAERAVDVVAWRRALLPPDCCNQLQLMLSDRIAV